jgi:hypothetical protein
MTEGQKSKNRLSESQVVVADVDAGRGEMDLANHESTQPL